MTPADDGTAAEFHVKIASTGDVLGVPAGKPIVQVLKENGYLVETSCTSGLCGTCKVRYLEGEVDHKDYVLNADEKSEYLTTCVSRAKSAEIVLDLPPPGTTPLDAIMRPTAVVNQDICVACLTCVRACTYGAATIDSERVGVGGIMGAAVVDGETCSGCGLCVAACPTGAISMTRYADNDVFAEVGALFAADAPAAGNAPRIATFSCPNCAPSVSAFPEGGDPAHPVDLKSVEMPCTGRIDNLHIMRAFESGADAVIVAGCEPGWCHHKTGNENAAKRVDRATLWLDDVGLGGGRIRMLRLPREGADQFAEAVAAYADEVRALGPSPLRAEDETAPADAGKSAIEDGPEDAILRQLGQI